MSEYEKYSLLVEAIGTFITLVAVAVAIWGERIRRKWTKPKLVISLLDPAFNIAQPSGIKGWYYLISVTNDKPSSPAQNVRLLLCEVWRKDPSGSWYEHKFSGPVQIVWRWRNFSPQYPTIGPEVVATFGWLLENSDSFDLQLYLRPNNLRSSIPPKRIGGVPTAYAVITF
jgi:hypothetical protein